MDNTAIERIAAPDLSEDALALLQRFGDNDEAAFFLGRLVWQGEMAVCAPALFDIAADPARERYARIAAIRGVMAVGEAEQKRRLLRTIAADAGPLDRGVLGELLADTEATTQTVELVLQTLERAAPYERFKTTGLTRSLVAYIDRLPMMVDDAPDQPLAALVMGLQALMDRAPYVAHAEPPLSSAFAWLMEPALHAVDRLVAARAGAALAPASMAVLQGVAGLRYWGHVGPKVPLGALPTTVPLWSDLNDALYWTSIAAARARQAKQGRPVTDDWPIVLGGHLWAFGPADFDRCVGWIRSKSGDDRLVALARAVQLYGQMERPPGALVALHDAVAGDVGLEENLRARLDPKPSPAMEAMDEEHSKWEREYKAQETLQAKNRAEWVQALKANPDRVRHPPGLGPGAFSQDQYVLLHKVQGEGLSLSREDAANWRALELEFGEAVALAFHDAAIAHWRAYHPMLRSEGAEADSTPVSLVFAMAGLAIEAVDDPAFANQLSVAEAEHAFRYVTWELNGFPTWFEALYRAFPELGLSAMKTELLWELGQIASGDRRPRVLHDIVYHAPWLHADIAPTLLAWLQTHELNHVDGLHQGLDILMGGGVSPAILAALARDKTGSAAAAPEHPRWFALWVGVEPHLAIPALEARLAALSPGEASVFAQRFAVALLGNRRGGGARANAYRSAPDLKALYVLMHRYIRAADDIDRAGKGVYSPTLRDDAQDARNTLFNLLSQIPGPDAYAALKALERDHPEPDYRRWMAAKARARAVADADEPSWTVAQVRAFAERVQGAAV